MITRWPPQDRVIKSIQSGSIAIGNSETNHAATITAVDLTKSICLFGGCYDNDTTPDKVVAGVYLSDATTVTAYRGAASTSTCTVRYTVVEFY